MNSFGGDAKTISRLLASRITELCAELLPIGRRAGHEWRVGSVAGEPGDSLGVHLIGRKAGVWRDFAAGVGGDPLDLVAAVLGLSIGEAMDWSRRWLGLPADRERAVKPRKPDPRPAADNDANRERALDIWREAQEDIVGTPAEAYLRARGADPEKLCSLHAPGGFGWPATLRYTTHAAADPKLLCRALIVAVHHHDTGLVTAVHRILLHSDGKPVLNHKKKRKLALGPIAGNAARFDYAPAKDGRWGLAEGPESALAAYQLNGVQTWSAISGSNMANVTPPDWARHIIIWADHDDKGLRYAYDAKAKLLRDGFEDVRIFRPCVPGADPADVLREAAQ